MDDNIIEAEDRPTKNHVRQKFTDIHCHCLPALDDGPTTIVESIELCRMLAIEGFSTVVATPHQLGRFEHSNNVTKVKNTVRSLNDEIYKNRIPLKVVPGAEVRVDERICQLLKAHKILTLADSSKYILLELPYQVFIDIKPLLIELSSISIQPVISHAELITQLVSRTEVVSQWLEYSTHLQITAASIIGDFGPEAQKAAMSLIESGWATIVATDSHNTKFRRPRMRAAYELICTKYGEELANLVCIENPSRIVNGQDILSVSLYEQQKENR